MWTVERVLRPRGVGQGPFLESSTQSLSGANGSGGSYTSSLTISPLADQDDGTYTCTVTVTGGSNVLQATASDDIIITVNGEKMFVTSFPTQQDCETD